MQLMANKVEVWIVHRIGRCPVEGPLRTVNISMRNTISVQKMDAETITESVMEKIYINIESWHEI